MNKVHSAQYFEKIFIRKKESVQKKENLSLTKLNPRANYSTMKLLNFVVLSAILFITF